MSNVKIDATNHAEYESLRSRENVISSNYPNVSRDTVIDYNRDASAFNTKYNADTYHGPDTRSTYDKVFRTPGAWRNG